MPIDFDEITRLGTKEQLQALQELILKNEIGYEALKERPDFKKMADAPDIDSQSEAYKNLTEETKDIWTDLSKQSKEIKQLPFHLYTSSPHEKVRTEMQNMVDAFIDDQFSEDRLLGRAPEEGQEDTRVSEINYFHDLLHLSTYGGKITRERPDAYHIAYEFNVQNEDGYQPAAPWNPMETLFERGLTRVYSEETKDNNLTPIGKAVLSRLNEKYGEPEVAKTFTKQLNL